MDTKPGLIVERIGMVGTTANGEYVGIETQFDTGAVGTILIPFGLCQKLMLGLMASADMARREQVQRLGTNESVIAHAGFAPFRPSGYELGRGLEPDGAPFVLMRLKQGELPVVDVAMEMQDAERLGADLLDEVHKGHPEVTTPQ